MATNEHPSSNDVGFGNPPKHTRFQKGVSGNPKGRPKGTHNLATVIARTLREKVVINENGIRKVVTKLEAAVKQLANKAASGDLVAMRLLTALTVASESNSEEAQQTPALSDADLKVMNGVLKRFQLLGKGEKDGHDE
jgi:hypothetical protein